MIPDDRVLAATRWAAWVVTPVLLVGGTILYGFPGRTEQLWAWPISPQMTPITMGAGYLAGAVFFFRAAKSSLWSEVALGFVGASILSVLLLVTTILHWDRFSHGHVAFWAWLVVYVAAPIVLPLLWVRNRPHDPGQKDDDRLVATPVRVVLGGAGVLLLLVAVALFGRPGLGERWWPWTLTPLTARTLAAFVAFTAVVWAAFAVESRWRALRLHVESAALGLALVAIGTARSTGDFDNSSVAIGYIALLIAIVTGLLGLSSVLRRPVPARAQKPGTGPAET